MTAEVAAVGCSSRFLESLLRLNALGGGEFAGWDLLPGMRFGEREAWWRDGEPRDAPHEGLDLAAFRDRDGRRVPLAPGVRIPALWAATAVAVVPDFLGHSVFVAHGRRDEGGRRLHSVCGHLVPSPGLAAGSVLAAGDEVGAIAGPAARRSSVPPHLHLTVAWIADAPPGTLDWSVLRDQARTVLVDPLPLVCGMMHARRSRS